MRIPWATLGIALAGLTSAVSAEPPNGLDGDGFIQKWLILAPIPMGDGENGEEALARKQIKEEAALKPKAGDKLKIGTKDLVWKAHSCTDHMLDFNAALDGTTEDSVAYAVAYITAPDVMKGVRLKIGSDDQCKIWLNGKEVFKYTDDRAADKDQDSIDVSLQKGLNVLAVKVVNGKADWSFCARFTNKNDKPLTKLQAKSPGK